MKNFLIVLFCLVILLFYSVNAELVPIYEGEINVNVGEDVEVIIGEPPEFEVTEPCISGETKCVGTYYFVCIDEQWVNQGQVDGKCGYTAGGAPTGPTGGASSGDRDRERECIENWQCSSWSACVDGRRTRDCEDMAECGTIELKPATTRSCSVEAAGEEEEEITLETSTSEEQETKQEGFISAVTGAVIGTLGPAATIGVLIFIIAIVAIAIYVAVMKRKARLRER